MSDHPVVVIVVFVSLGCVFLFCCCLYAVWCFLIKKRKECVEKAEIIRDDEHFKVKEDIVKGPGGAEAVVITMEKDKHFEEKIVKNEREIEGKHMHGKNGEISAGEYIEYKS